MLSTPLMRSNRISNYSRPSMFGSLSGPSSLLRHHHHHYHLHNHPRSGLSSSGSFCRRYITNIHAPSFTDQEGGTAVYWGTFGENIHSGHPAIFPPFRHLAGNITDMDLGAEHAVALCTCYHHKLYCFEIVFYLIIFNIF
eukprot:gb/GECH01013668.1/.p1 GENE.gb/GECH01013668.1/~~gb/GECH01013668.1/.p1  ORF type:complete len:140 (+),score=14.25 gb/GECH01013668.1/:1-420(+)